MSQVIMEQNSQSKTINGEFTSENKQEVIDKWFYNYKQTISNSLINKLSGRNGKNAR